MSLIHSVIGLDMSLLDRNRYLEDTGGVDDDDLEQAFTSTGERNNEDVDAPDLPESNLPQKRTREDIINDLKRKRAKQDEPNATTSASGESRFKPIGRPAAQNQKKVKKVSKKKAQESAPPQLTPVPPVAVVNEPILKPSPPSQQERALDEDPAENIFEGIDDYDGLGEDDLSSSESEKAPAAGSKDSPPPPNEHKPQRTNWFDDPDQEEDALITEQPPIPPADSAEKGKARMPSPEETPPMRLQPLASSKIRSISEYLDLQKSLEEEEKRKAKREKRKGKKKE
jgi:IK cytokine